MNDVLIVFRKELREILRDRRTLIAIGLAALATPVILFVVSQVTDSGYILRRASDDSELPRPVPFAAVRHRRRNMWWV